MYISHAQLNGRRVFREGNTQNDFCKISAIYFVLQGLAPQGAPPLENSALCINYFFSPTRFSSFTHRYWYKSRNLWQILSDVFKLRSLAKRVLTLFCRLSPSTLETIQRRKTLAYTLHYNDQSSSDLKQFANIADYNLVLHKNILTPPCPFPSAFTHFFTRIEIATRHGV